MFEETFIELKEIIARMPGNIYWKNKQGHYLGCNENVATMLGLPSPAAIIGKTLFDLLPEEMAQTHEQNDQRVLQHGRELVIEEHSIGLDQQPAIYLSRKLPLFNEQGEVVGLLGMSQDISLYKKREHDLEHAKDAAEKNLAQIVSFLPGNIYWKDIDHRYLGCNENQAKVFGLNSTNEIIGKRNADFPVLNKHIAELADLNDKKVIQSSEEMIFEERGIDASGDDAVYLSRKIPLFESGKIKGTLGVSLDITQRKKAEQELNEAKELAEKAVKAKADFFINMSHDLKTPLTGVIGILDILMRKDTDESTKELLGYAFSSSQKLLNIINDVFEVVNEDVKKTVKNETVDLRKILDNTCDLLKPEILRKNLSLQLHIDPDFQVKIISEKSRLEKLILNLITNAVKFTDEGFVNVYLNVLNKADNDIQFEIKIEDSGCGISEQDIPNLFEKFTRADNESTQNVSGTGLGLWMVKNIVEALNGTIKLDSELDRGTTVTCQFTAAIAESEVVKCFQ